RPAGSSTSLRAEPPASRARRVTAREACPVIVETPPVASAPPAPAANGARREVWKAELPTLVDSPCERWAVEPDGAARRRFFAVVVPVRRDGQSLVIKLSASTDAITAEAAALGAWDGNGAVRVVDQCLEPGALLLERLDAPTLRTLEPFEAARLA